MLGLYDSGLGGITILKEVQKQLPGIEICYFADTKHCPLGEKTATEILENTKNGVEFLFNKGCNLVVLACNTATVTAIRILQNNWLPKYYPDKKILGIVRPVPEFLIENKIHTQQNLILLATPATVASNFYQQELKDFHFHNLLAIPCPGLAGAIENQDNQKIEKVLNLIFKPYQKELAKQDVMILACTHYPIINNKIKSIFLNLGGNFDIIIFDQTELVSNKLTKYLKNHPEIILESGETTIYASKNVEEFRAKVNTLFDYISVQYKNLE